MYSIARVYPLSPSPAICPVHTGCVSDLCLNSSLSEIFDICTSTLIQSRLSRASLIATLVCVNAAGFITIPAGFSKYAS